MKSDGSGITYKGQPTVPGQSYPLDVDFQRMKPSSQIDSLIEVVAVK
jgi:hypothetical protein